jgi:hypothetical protein
MGNKSAKAGAQPRIVEACGQIPIQYSVATIDFPAGIAY